MFLRFPVRQVALFLSLYLLVTACGTTRKTTLLRDDFHLEAALMGKEVAKAEKSYVIKTNDILDIRVYTNKGEMLIDPNRELMKDAGPDNETMKRPTYLVSPAGTVHLPMVGDVKIADLQLQQADSVMQKAYEQYYEGPYVTSSIINKRVTVLGASGGKVIPLSTPDMTLLEVLALSGHLPQYKPNMTNIRIVRGDLQNPSIMVVDLTSFEGLTKHNLVLQPNDVIYVEPVASITETLREVLPVISLLVQAVTVYLLILRTSNTE